MMTSTVVRRLSKVFTVNVLFIIFGLYQYQFTMSQVGSWSKEDGGMITPETP